MNHLTQTTINSGINLDIGYYCWFKNVNKLKTGIRYDPIKKIIEKIIVPSSNVYLMIILLY